jgi:hypothetical protein
VDHRLETLDRELPDATSERLAEAALAESA